MISEEKINQIRFLYWTHIPHKSPAFEA